MAGSSEPPLPTANGADPTAELSDMIEPVVPARIAWLANLVAAGSGDRVVDLGCGAGSTLEAIAMGRASRPVGPHGRVGPASATPAVDVELVGIDSSATAVAAAAATLGRLPPASWLLAVADLGAGIPLADQSVDRAVSHNVLECLPNPAALLEEATRVLRPGGRLVLSHTDFDTLVFSSEDRALTRRLVHAYSDTQQTWMGAVDGTIGRRLPDLVGRSRLRVNAVEASAVVSRRWAPGELGYGYAHNLVEALTHARAADPDELAAWVQGLARLAERDAFLFSLNDYAVVATAPPLSTRVSR
jgi:ubiquinone/menaquinone biosynthesis C-methylase UbiE